MPEALVSPDRNPSCPPLPPPFACSLIHGDPDATCVHVTGELDIATAPELALTLRDAQAQTRLVVLDLGSLAFIDGAGVHAIVDATDDARERGRRLVVLPGPPNVERLFTLTATDGHLERGDTSPPTSSRRPHHGVAKRSSRGSGGPDFGGAFATRIARNVTGTLLTRVVAAVPWLRSARQ